MRFVMNMQLETLDKLYIRLPLYCINLIVRMTLHASNLYKASAIDISDAG